MIPFMHYFPVFSTYNSTNDHLNKLTNTLQTYPTSMNPNQTIYLDSQETIYENLKENNPFIINNSVPRITQHIKQRIDNASKRLADIEQYSLSRNKKGSFVNTGNKNGSFVNTGNKNESRGKNMKNNDNFSISQMKTIKTNKKKICSKHECQFCGKHFNEEDCDQELLQKIKQLSLQIKNKKACIEDLEDKLVNIEVQSVRKQQKFLQEQKKYILEINRLNKMLEEAEQKQWRIQCQKAQLFDQLAESQNRTAQFQERLLDIGEEKLLWKKKNESIINLKKKYVQNLQKKQNIIDPINQTNNQSINLLKQFIRNLKNIIQIGETNTKFFNDKKKIIQSARITGVKEAQSFGKNTGMRKTIQPMGQILAPMTQSYCITQIQEEENGNYIPESSEDILTPLSLLVNHKSSNQEEKNNEDFYRMLFVQAETIEKLGIL